MHTHALSMNNVESQCLMDTSRGQMWSPDLILGFELFVFVLCAKSYTALAHGYSYVNTLLYIMLEDILYHYILSGMNRSNITHTQTMSV
jgi:hypothetical protein